MGAPRRRKKTIAFCAVRRCGGLGPTLIMSTPRHCKKTVRFVRYGSGVGGSNPYEHPAALQKTGVSRSTAVALGGVQPLWACRGLQKLDVSRSTTMTARTSVGGVRPFKGYGHLGALQKNDAFRAVRWWRRAESDPYGHPAALQKPRVARGTAVAAGRIRPSINYGQPAALQKPRVPCSTAVAAGGVRPLWTPRGTAKT